MDFIQLKNNFEDSIRRGDIVSVRNEIESLKPSSIPRNLASDFADIARRVRSETWGLRLLRPIVRAQPAAHPKASDQELCTYAGLLIKAGTLPEARILLQSLDPNKNINVLIFLGQIAIAQWNYRDSIPYLKKVQNSVGLDPYQRCIAQVNLAVAYIFLERYKAAKNVLQKILSQCIQNKWDLLYGNALEISAQLAVAQKNWPEAMNFLKEAESRAGQHSHYQMFIEKWRTISELYQTVPNSVESDLILDKIEQLKKKAQSLKSWESVRDFDYHIALYLNHQNLLLNVYFGTPHSEYKKRIENIFKKKGWKIPNFYFRKLSERPADRIFDLTTGNEENKSLAEPLKPGQLLHRCLNILTIDFYKPVGAGELFSKLFPEEYFNPDVSIDRLTQATKLLRKWFEINCIPLNIEVEQNRYLLAAHGPYAFKVSKKTTDFQNLPDSAFDVNLKRLKVKWPYQSFSATKAAVELGISPTGARSLLLKATKEKCIYKSGDGRSILYRFQK